jgi:polyhydroxyalkanoate synthesis regulator phasin
MTSFDVERQNIETLWAKGELSSDQCRAFLDDIDAREMEASEDVQVEPTTLRECVKAELANEASYHAGLTSDRVFLARRQTIRQTAESIMTSCP